MFNRVTPWNADGKWLPGVITEAEVNRLEAEGAPADVIWPLGSPRNYFLGCQLTVHLHDESRNEDYGDSGDLGITAAGGDDSAPGSLQKQFGDWKPFANDHDPYIYTFRNEKGAPHLVHEQDVLDRIGRTYGQAGA